MKICPNCKIEFDEKFTFCYQCGGKLQDKIDVCFCPYCGNKIETDGEFCPYCGNLLIENTPIEKDGTNSTQSDLAIDNIGKQHINHITPAIIKEKESRREIENSKLNLKNDDESNLGGEILNLSISNFKKSDTALHKRTKIQDSSDPKSNYNNAFFGFAGRIGKRAFAIRVFFAELLLLGMCYFSLLNYWRLLIIGNIAWMLGGFFIVGLIIYGLVKRRREDTNLSDGFIINSAFFIVAISVIAKFCDIQMNDSICYVFMIVSILFTLNRLWVLFTTEPREILYTGKEIEIHPIVFVNLLLVFPIYYFFYKNVISMAYDIP